MPSPRPGPTPNAARSTAALPLWAVLCFLFSGAAGLLYEVVWSKQLAYLLGGSLQSVATVVAAFLGGLALGARFLGGRLAERPGLARSYALLEVGVAVLGLALLPVLRSLDLPVGQLYRAFGGESAGFAIARVVLLLVLLVPPAALMGATLPVLVARADRGTLGSGLAWLYAINTLGAVLGSVLGGFVLMPQLGLSATTFVAAALNVVAALIAWANASGEREAARTRTPVTEVTPLLDPMPRRIMAGLFALSGFTALLLQLAWVRLFGLVLGSSVYSFSSVLGVYLLGLALGSALVARWLARGVSAAGFSLLQLGIAATAVAGIHLYAGLPKAMLELGERSGTSWGGLLVGQLLLVGMVLFIPCVLLGAVFPVATRLLQRGNSGRSTGQAYAINTLGTIAGSLATGFWLLPQLGVQGVVLLAGTLAALAGVVALLLPSASRVQPRTWGVAALLLVLGLAAGVAAPRWDPLLMSLGTFRPVSAQNLRATQGGAADPTRALAASQDVLFYHDGINASVLVVTDKDRKKVWMRVGGKVDAGTGDMLTQELLGLLPTAFADSGARTLVVGHGSGVTSAAALAAGAGPTDIVELEPAVITGSRFFHEKGRDPLDDPRVTLHMEDARTLLAHGEGRYGVIISEPSNPWIAGVNNLFTVDFYRRVRTRLTPDGVFCQWVQTYELSPATFKSMLASFLTVFPDAHLFCLWGSADALLIAAPPGASLSLARLRAPQVAYELERAGLASAGQIAAFHVASGVDLRTLAAGAELNTDERPFVEYRAPRDMIEVGRGFDSHHPGVTSLFALPVVPSPGHPLDGWPLDQVAEWRARQRVAKADAAGFELVMTELRAAGLAAVASRLSDERVRMARASNEADPLAEAKARLATGDAAAAEAIARRVLAGSQGAARLEPLLTLGIAQYMARRPQDALVQFTEAQRIAPADGRAYNFEARIRLTTGDPDGARRALERGLAQAPGDSALTLARRALESSGQRP